MARYPRTFCAMACLTAVGLLNGGDARAYNEPGHLESVRLLVDRLPEKMYTSTDRRVLITCAQLPDMSEELDAARLYISSASDSPFGWLGWAFSDSLRTDALKRMFAAQQLLHGLTGGSADSVARVALKTLAALAVPRSDKGPEPVDRFERLCALGLGLHLFGDALAHTQLSWDQERPSSELVMYPTGRGHGLSDQHLPDYILCSYLSKSGWNGNTSCNQDWTGDQLHMRLKRWIGYWAGGYGQIVGQPAASNMYSDLEIKDLEARLKVIQTGRAPGLENGDVDSNDLAAGERIAAFLAARSSSDVDIDQFAKQARSDDKTVLTQHHANCADVLSHVLLMKDVSGIPGSNAPSCARIWSIYSAASIASYQAELRSPQVVAGTRQMPMDRAWAGHYSAATGEPDISRFAKLLFAAH